MFSVTWLPFVPHVFYQFIKDIAIMFLKFMDETNLGKVEHVGGQTKYQIRYLKIRMMV